MASIDRTDVGIIVGIKKNSHENDNEVTITACLSGPTHPNRNPITINTNTNEFRKGDWIKFAHKTLYKLSTPVLRTIVNEGKVTVCCTITPTEERITHISNHDEESDFTDDSTTEVDTNEDSILSFPSRNSSCSSARESSIIDEDSTPIDFHDQKLTDVDADDDEDYIEDYMIVEKSPIDDETTKKNRYVDYSETYITNTGTYTINSIKEEEYADDSDSCDQFFQETSANEETSSEKSYLKFSDNESIYNRYFFGTDNNDDDCREFRTPTPRRRRLRFCVPNMGFHLPIEKKKIELSKEKSEVEKAIRDKEFAEKGKIGIVMAKTHDRYFVYAPDFKYDPFIMVQDIYAADLPHIMDWIEFIPYCFSDRTELIRVTDYRKINKKYKFKKTKGGIVKVTMQLKVPMSKEVKEYGINRKIPCDFVKEIVDFKRLLYPFKKYEGQTIVVTLQRGKFWFRKWDYRAKEMKKYESDASWGITEILSNPNLEHNPSAMVKERPEKDEYVVKS